MNKHDDLGKIGQKNTDFLAWNCRPESSGSNSLKTWWIVGEGPILGALNKLTFDELHILHDQENSKADAYVDWLSEHTIIKVVLSKCSLRSPIDFGDIHRVMDSYLEKLTTNEPGSDVSIH